MMKKLITTYTACLVILFGAVTMQSCDKNFEETNTNPNAVSTVVPDFVFTKAQYDGASNTLALFLGHMQYTTSFNDVAGFGSKYVTNQSLQTAAAFSSAYPNSINEIGIVIKAVKDD